MARLLPVKRHFVTAGYPAMRVGPALANNSGRRHAS
jgi:hypothetical protein